ncbi:MAG: hypothetical protein DRI36_05405 [Caldiserica bacterium]|mgnify:CR=1 FL=1|nr:MAG: hypothetical protein DRI36_05405 [Caldisericota bacterium]
MNEVELLKETVKTLEKRDKAITEISSLLQFLSNKEKVIEGARKIIKETIPSEEVVIMLIDEKTGEFLFYPEKEENKITEKEERYYREISNYYSIFKKGEEIDSENKPEIILPIKRGNSIIGAVGVFNSKHFRYSLLHVKLVKSILECFKNILENAVLLSKLENEISKMNYLLRLQRELFLIKDKDKLLSRIAEEGRKLIDAEGCSILLKKEEGKLEFVAVSGGKEELKGKEIDDDKGIAGISFKEGRPVMVNDVEKDEHFDSSIDQQTGFITRNIACCPLKRDSDCLGVIECVNKIEGRNFTTDDLMHLELLSEITVILLETLK